MQFGMMVEPQVGGSYPDLLRLARWAEATGFDVFARSDHYLNGARSMPTTDALISLAGIARETERIELATLVSPITFRHPAVMAKSAATLDEMSGGRFRLGVGTGWMESEHAAFDLSLPGMRERFERLEEALAYISACLRPDPGGFSGRFYRVEQIEVLPRPTGPLPLVVGGTGKRRTPELAGRYAGEYNMVSTTPEAASERIDVMRKAAAAAGRDPADVLVSMMGQVLVAPTEHAYRALVEAEAAKRDIAREEMEARLAARSVPRGTPAQAGETLAELAAVGVGRFYLQHFDALDHIDTAGTAWTLGALKDA